MGLYAWLAKDDPASEQPHQPRHHCRLGLGLPSLRGLPGNRAQRGPAPHRGPGPLAQRQDRPAGCGLRRAHRHRLPAPGGLRRHRAEPRQDRRIRQGINDVFPHWFNAQFKQFNNDVQRLPFDQNCLVALCAPRPVLFSAAEGDQWANPAGQFQVLQAPTPFTVSSARMDWPPRNSRRSANWSTVVSASISAKASIPWGPMIGMSS